MVEFTFLVKNSHRCTILGQKGQKLKKVIFSRKKLSSLKIQPGWRPQGGGGIYGGRELSGSSTEMKPLEACLDSRLSYGWASSALTCPDGSTFTQRRQPVACSVEAGFRGLAL